VARGDKTLRRGEVGFSGGQAIMVSLSEKAHEDLCRVVQDRGGWYEVEDEDGTVALDLAQVVFVKTVAAERRVGFSGV